MYALTLNHDGFSQTQNGPVIDDAADWLTGQNVAKPEISKGQVLIKVKKAAVNPSDLHFIKGEYGQPRRQGAPAGFEGYGVVEDGPKALIGQRVAFVVTPDGSGSWAEYAVTQAQSCVPLIDAVSDVDGAGLLVNPLTAMAMMDIAKSHSDAVVITAANSQLGKLMLGLAAELGLAAIATVRSQTAADAIARFNPAATLITADNNFPQAARDAIAAHKPRTILDAVGDQTVETVFALMPARSRWISYGKLSTQAPQLTQMGHFIFLDKHIEGFWLSKWFTTADMATQMNTIKAVQTRYATQSWQTDVARTLPLHNVITGLADATKLSNGKVIIDVS